MSPEHRKQHRLEVINFIKRTDVSVMQGEPITEDLINRNWNRVVTVPPQSDFVTPQQLEERAYHARQVGIHEHQARQAAEEQRFAAMSEDERELLASEQLVELSRAKLNKARAQRQTLAIERYELELEQREAVVADQKSRLAVLAQRHTHDLALQEDPDFRYALTSAEINAGMLDPMSDDAVQNSVWINALKSATPETFKGVVKEFHQWEAARYGRIRAAAQEAEVAALRDAAPNFDALQAANQQIADAGLKAADALHRANKVEG